MLTGQPTTAGHGLFLFVIFVILLGIPPQAVLKVPKFDPSQPAVSDL